MASDASIYGLEGQGVTPLLNPLDVQARKNALALQAQQLQLQSQQQQQNALAIQQTQRTMAYDQANRAALQHFYNGDAAADPTAPIAATPTPIKTTPTAPATGSVITDPVTGQPLPGAPAYAAPSAAAAPPPAAAAPGAAAPAPVAVPPRPAVPTMQDLIRLGADPATASGMVAGFQKVAETAANIDKANAEADKARKEANDLVTQQQAEMADQVLHGPKTPDGLVDPRFVGWHLDMFASHGPQYAAMANQVRSQLGQMTPAQQTQFLIGLTQAPKQIEADAAATTAAAKKLDSENEQKKTDLAVRTGNQELLDKDVQDLAARLGGAQNQADWQTILSRSNPAAVAALNVPPAFSKANQSAVVTKAQTANQQTTAAIDRAKVGEEAQNIALRLKLFNQQYGDPAQGATPAELTTAAARANGDLPLPSPRSKGYDREIALAASQDPTFAQFANTRADTKKNFKEKGDSDDIVQLATALEHLQRAKTNSADMGFEPTLGTNLFPIQHQYHQDVYNLTDEVGRLIKHGVMTETETKRGIDNLTSSFQGNRDAGLDELTNLMGGKVAAKIQKYIAGTGQLVPASLFDADTQQRLKAAGFAKGIDWTKGAAPTPAPGPAPPAAPPTPKAAGNAVPVAGGTFNGEKVVSVQRVQ